MFRTTLLLTFACLTSFAAGCAPGEQSIDADNDPTVIEVEEILSQDDASVDPGEGDRGILYEPGDDASATVTTDFGCSSKRRWKFYINAVDTDGSSSEVVVYYPSSTGWTTATSINLGNVAAYF